MDDLPKLLVRESVIELTVDVFELVNREFSPSLEIVKAEVGSSSLLAEWVSLSVK